MAIERKCDHCKEVVSDEERAQTRVVFTMPGLEAGVKVSSFSVDTGLDFHRACAAQIQNSVKVTWDRSKQ